MKNFTSFSLVFVVIISTFAAAGPVQISSRNTKDIADPLDAFEDVIYETLGLTVKQLLERTESTFIQLNNVTTEGAEKLEDIISKASPEVKKELEQINEDIFKAVLGAIFGEFLGDLGNVIPKLSSIPNSPDDEVDDGPAETRSAADIIRAILGKTLEVFVTAIKDALEQSSNLLTSVMVKFKELEQEATRPEVAEALRFISENYLLRGKMEVEPVLDDFRKLV